MNLNLPNLAIPDRVSIKRVLRPREKYVYANLDGPGCINHIWVTPTRVEDGNRDTVIRIFFDDEPIPYVEAPIGDFFGVMHGKKFYPLNTPYISAAAECGYNCYFKMPFAKSAKIELEAGDQGNTIYLMVDWHRYPGQVLEESRRFCSRWRRESPASKYGEDYIILDADGPGELLGFVYGVRLFDNTDRWSHGGGDNIYIDGMGDYPAYIRGIGGEDSFGVGFGGALHSPTETYLYHGMPYYVHEDIGEARPAQCLVGYRFFAKDTIAFRESIHIRFGSMCNDICSNVYWYQEKPVRPFFIMPDFKYLLSYKRKFELSASKLLSPSLPRGTYDLPIPNTGEWWICGPFNNKNNKAMKSTLKPETEVEVMYNQVYDGMHEEGSLWLTKGSREVGINKARWKKRSAIHGYIDFRHVFRPIGKGVAPSEDGVALARCELNVPKDKKVTLQIAWSDELLLRVNNNLFTMGDHYSFRDKKIVVNLAKGSNSIILKLSNSLGSNHGGWTFSFKATTEDGTTLIPRICENDK